MVILLDSITRLARAYNKRGAIFRQGAVGGVDAAAPQRPGRFFGAPARSKKAARSPSMPRRWSIPAAAWDEVIFEEFKGTAIAKSNLNRRLYERRSSPPSSQQAVDAAKSAAGRLEILQKTRILRQFMYNMDEIESMELMIKNMKATKRM